MEQNEYIHMYEEEATHWWYVGMRKIVQSLLPRDNVPVMPKILDVGCGSGFNLGWFRDQYGAWVAGVDKSSLGLELCRKRRECNLARADASSLPFPDGSFDLVVSFDVLTGLESDLVRTNALTEFRRVLKPEGRLLLRVAAYEWLRSSHDTEVMTYHRYGMKELQTAVTKSGFQPLRLTGANIILFPVAVVWRLLKKAGVARSGSDVRRNTRGSNRLNRLMASILNCEAIILRCTGFSFPYGLSIFLLASKAASNPHE